MTLILEVHNLSVRYTKKNHSIPAVRGINLSLFSGKTLALVGESGCGKSSLAKALVPQLPHSNHCEVEGEVLYEGNNIITPNASKKIKPPRFGLVFQDPYGALNPTMKIGKQIAEAIPKQKGRVSNQIKDRVLLLLTMCGIDHPQIWYNQYPHQLSGGMRQRVVLAIALAINPQILIADEPTTALDVTIQKQILDLLVKIQKQTQCAILFISHDLSVVSRISDDICIMYGGKILESGNTQKVLFSPKHPYTKLLMNAHPSLSTNPSPIDGKSFFHSSYPHNGCPFVARCPSAMQICAKIAPIEDIDSQCACHLYDERVLL